MQTPITITGPSDVCVTPETNRPGGIGSVPTSSTCTQGSRDQSTTLRRPARSGYP